MGIAKRLKTCFDSGRLSHTASPQQFDAERNVQELGQFCQFVADDESREWMIGFHPSSPSSSSHHKTLICVCFSVKYMNMMMIPINSYY